MKLRQMQDSWYNMNADEIQKYADNYNTKHFYDVLKELYGPQPAGSSPLLSVDETRMLTEKKQILDRWVENFNNVLNCPAEINDLAISRQRKWQLTRNLTKRQRRKKS